MSVRVIAGTAKGRRLAVPRLRGLRPTGDRARESLFNVLAPRLTGCSFLDVFAGSGAVGIEALSRGAASAIFVERDARAAATLADNLALCGFGDAAQIIRAPWRAAMRRLGQRGTCFDVAFFDPPYDWAQTHTLLEELAAGSLLTGEGIVVVEHRTGSPPQATTGWQSLRVLQAGDTSFSFFGILTDP
jgi:16S rRNA (guanine(966)-N(2))-methyltransferase RsmD